MSEKKKMQTAVMSEKPAYKRAHSDSVETKTLNIECNKNFQKIINSISASARTDLLLLTRY